MERGEEQLSPSEQTHVTQFVEHVSGGNMLALLQRICHPVFPSCFAASVSRQKRGGTDTIQIIIHNYASKIF